MQLRTSILGALVLACMAGRVEAQTPKVYPTSSIGVPMAAAAFGTVGGPATAVDSSHPLPATDSAVLTAIQANAPAVGTGTSAAAKRVVIANDSPAGAISSNFRLDSSAASTNAILVKPSYTILKSVSLTNTSAAPVFLKLYSLSAPPVVGTSAPYLVVTVPANSVRDIDIPEGEVFNLGLAFALTANVASSDTTPVAAGVIINLNLGYI